MNYEDGKQLAPSLTKALIPTSNVYTSEHALQLSQMDSVKKAPEGGDDANTDTPIEKPPPKKMPSKDSPLRWASLIIFLVISIPLLLITVILVAAL